MGPRRYGVNFGSYNIVSTTVNNNHILLHLYIHLNPEHGETEGNESLEAEKNVSFCPYFLLQNQLITLTYRIFNA